MKENNRKYENVGWERRRPKYGCTKYRHYKRDFAKLVDDADPVSRQFLLSKKRT